MLTLPTLLYRVDTWVNTKRKEKIQTADKKILKNS